MENFTEKYSKKQKITNLSVISQWDRGNKVNSFQTMDSNMMELSGITSSMGLVLSGLKMEFIMDSLKMDSRMARASLNGTTVHPTKEISKKTRGTGKDFSSQLKAVSKVNGKMIKFKALAILWSERKALAENGGKITTKNPTNSSDIFYF
jgi:hypothetical protein